MVACGRTAGGYFFFFQAEDGIRDLTVTGVQTCAFRSRRDLEAAERIAEAIGAREERLYNAWVHGQIERWEGNLDSARQLLESGIQEAKGETHPFGQIHACMLASLGHLELDAGDVPAAR